MASRHQFDRSILISSAIVLLVLTLSNPSSAGKKKTPYVCATANDVVIRQDVHNKKLTDMDFIPVGRMSKGQCIKLFVDPVLYTQSRNGERYYGLQRDMRGIGVHAGWVSTRFTKIQYR
jgi:hypothetical protein